MTSFIKIFSRHFPQVDITKPAFYNLSDETIINKDFFAYSIVNSMSFKKGALDYYSVHTDENIELTFTQYKFKILKQNILESAFINKEKKSYYLYSFEKAQLLYHFFCKCARQFKIKKALPSPSNLDFHMNDLSKLDKNLLIKIYDDKTRINYTFRLSNILTIIKTSLSNSVEFFSEPHKIKNPYTNVEFTDAQLYTIYFKLRNSSFVMPTLFHLFFKHQFNLKEFELYNEPLIRTISIKQFLNSDNTDEKCCYILYMLRDYQQYLPSISIHPQFPNDVLLKAFDNMLVLYMNAEFSLIKLIRQKNKNLLIKKLKLFNEYNPKFGRKIYERNNDFAINIDDANIPFVFGENSSNGSNESHEYRYSFVTNINHRHPQLSPRRLNRLRRFRRNRYIYRSANAITNIYIEENTNETQENNETGSVYETPSDSDDFESNSNSDVEPEPPFEPEPSLVDIASEEDASNLTSINEENNIAETTSLLETIPESESDSTAHNRDIPSNDSSHNIVQNQNIILNQNTVPVYSQQQQQLQPIQPIQSIQPVQTLQPQFMYPFQYIPFHNPNPYSIQPPVYHPNINIQPPPNIAQSNVIQPNPIQEQPLSLHPIVESYLEDFNSNIQTIPEEQDTRTDDESSFVPYSNPASIPLPETPPTPSPQLSSGDFETDENEIPIVNISIQNEVDNENQNENENESENENENDNIQ